MNEENQKKFITLPPYDESLNEHLKFYDKVTYKLDINICGRNTIKLNSGNLLKYYRCQRNGTYKVSNQDEKISKFLEDTRKRTLSLEEQSEVIYDDENNIIDITDEQVQSLIEDTDNTDNNMVNNEYEDDDVNIV